MAFIQALQVVGHLCCRTKQMFHISRTTLARTSRHVHGVCRTPGGISTTTIRAFCMWHVRKQPLTIKPILKIGNLKTQMTAHWRTHTSMSPSGENPTPSWLYVLTFRVSVQAYRALSVTLYLLRQHLFILCIKQTVIVGHNIADLRLIYVLHCREWCYYGKSMSLLLFCGAGRGVHTAAPIIQLLTLLSRAERERDGEMLQPNGRQCCLLKRYQAPVLPLMCDITLWVQPAQPVWEKAKRRWRVMWVWRHGRTGDMDHNAGIRSVESNILHVTLEHREYNSKTIIC